MKITVSPAYHKNNLGIVLAADKNYVPYMAVTIASIHQNAEAGLNYDIIVLADGITEEQKEQLRLYEAKNFSIRYVDVRQLLAGMDAGLFKSRGIWSAAACYRLFIPQLMPDYEKVLYLDCDILVKDSLKDLFAVDLSGFQAGCVYDEVRYTAAPDRVRDITENLGLKDWRRYFNSGVVLFNIKEIKPQKFAKDFTEALQRPKLPFLDQDVLNILWQGKFKPLDGVWNYQYYTLIGRPDLRGEKELAAAEKGRRIIHYITQYKPWTNPELPHAGEWWLAARGTPFYEEIIYKNTRTSYLLLRNLMQYRRLLCRYTGYKFLKSFSFGGWRRRLNDKVNELKRQVKQVRAVYREKK